MNEDKLYRNMLVLMLCAAVLGTGFLCGTELKKTGREKQEEKVLMYELGWPDEKDGRAVFRRERYYLDKGTGQPWKIEKYFKYEPDGEYVLERTKIIDHSKGEVVEEATEDTYK